MPSPGMTDEAYQEMGTVWRHIYWLLVLVAVGVIGYFWFLY